MHSVYSYSYLQRVHLNYLILGYLTDFHGLLITTVTYVCVCLNAVFDVFQNNYGLLSLEISRVTKEDGGMYTVKAANLEGEVACSASLDIQGKEIC